MRRRLLLSALVLVLCFPRHGVAQTSVSGPINVNTTWDDSVYVVTGDVTVATGITLTILAGVEVRFNAGTDLVVNGALVADGTPADSILFTANSGSSAPSQWGSVWFNASAISTQSVMDHCVIRYSGDHNGASTGGDIGPVYLNARANPTVTNLRLYGNRWNGIHVVPGDYPQSIRLDIVGTPYFVLSDLGINAGFTLTIRPAVVMKFGSGADLSVDGALVATGTPDSMITFTSLQDDSAGNMDTDGGGISAGAPNQWGAIFFNTSSISTQSVLRYCRVSCTGDQNGVSSGGAIGPISLHARANPVVRDLTFSNNRWNGIQLVAGSYGQSIRLDVVDKPYFLLGDMSIASGYTLTLVPGTIVKFGDGADLDVDGALHAVGTADSLIRFTCFEDDSAGGIDTDGLGSSIGAPSQWGGVWLNRPAPGTESILAHCAFSYGGDNNGVSSGGDMGCIYVDPRLNPSLEHLTAYGNRYNGIEIRPGTYTEPLSLNARTLPYVLRSLLNVAATASLSVGPGVIVKCGASVLIDVSGVLVAAGEPDARILLTSLHDDSRGGDTDNNGMSSGVPGDWGGVLFRDASIDGLCVLTCVDIFYGGGSATNGSALLGMASASPRVAMSRFAHSLNRGIWCSGTAAPDLGLQTCTSPGMNSFTGFVGTPKYALYNDGTGSMTAVNACWGAGDSATIQAVIYDARKNPAKGLVTFIPFSTLCESLATGITRRYDVDSSWNLVAVPLRGELMTKAGVWRDAISQAFGFDSQQGYRPKTALEMGQGYWVKFSATTDSVPVRGVYVLSDAIALQAGWNLIGAHSVPVSVDDLVESPPGIVSSDFFAFHHGYAPADTLLPGRGYWVKALSPGVLTYCAPPVARRPRPGASLRNRAFRGENVTP